MKIKVGLSIISHNSFHQLSTARDHNLFYWFSTFHFSSQTNLSDWYLSTWVFSSLFRFFLKWSLLTPSPPLISYSIFCAFFLFFLSVCIMNFQLRGEGWGLVIMDFFFLLKNPLLPLMPKNIPISKFSGNLKFIKNYNQVNFFLIL